MRADWRRLLAFGFGSGLAAQAPGTWGTLATVPLFLLLTLLFPPIFICALGLPLFLLGVWVCGHVGDELGIEDYGGIVFDEIVAYLMVLGLVYEVHMALWQHVLVFGLSFGLFRLFDIFKPFPIGMLEKRIRGGFGVMLDDVLAAVYTLVVYFLIRNFSGDLLHTAHHW